MASYSQYPVIDRKAPYTRGRIAPYIKTVNSDTDCDQIPGPGRPVPAGAGVAEAVGLRVGDQRGALADVMFHDEQTAGFQ